MSDIVAGLDAGTEKSHLVWWDFKNNMVHGSIWKDRDNAEMLEDLRGYRRNGFDLAIESMDARGMRLGQDTLDTILWIGRFQEASCGVLVPRSKVKDVLCGNRKADDAAIRLRLMDMLGKPGTKKDPGPTFGVTGHCWQALAVAVTYHEMMKEVNK